MENIMNKTLFGEWFETVAECDTGDNVKYIGEAVYSTVEGFTVFVGILAEKHNEVRNTGTLVYFPYEKVEDEYFPIDAEAFTEKGIYLDTMEEYAEIEARKQGYDVVNSFIKNFN